MIVVIITNNDICLPKFDSSLHIISIRYLYIPLSLNIHTSLPRRDNTIPIYYNFNIHPKL